MTADRLLLFLLRADAAVVLCAAPCALLPFAWMDAVHRDWLGLGPLHDSPVTRYMARSLSLVYATHGAVVLAVTLDWKRYRPLVPVLACGVPEGLSALSRVRDAILEDLRSDARRAASPVIS